MAEDPKAGSGINYQVDDFEKKKRAADKAKSKKERLEKLSKIRQNKPMPSEQSNSYEKLKANDTIKRLLDRNEKSKPIPRLSTKKAQTLATSADKPKQIIQSKRMSSQNKIKKASVTEVISNALNKAKTAADKRLKSIKKKSN
jgi:hypothetical protein